MEQMEDKISNPDITDTGKTRRELEIELQKLKAKSTDAYNFLTYDGSQRNFIDVLLDIAKSYLDKVNKVENLFPEQISTRKHNQDEISVQIVNLERELQARKDELARPYDPSTIDERIREKQEKVITNEDIIARKTRDIKSRKTHMEEIDGKRRDLDTDQMMPVETVTYPVPQGAREFTATYHSKYPLDRISPHYSGYGVLSSIQTMPPMVQPGEGPTTGIDPRDKAHVRFYHNDTNARQGNYSETFRASEGLINVTIDFFAEKRYMNTAEIEQYWAVFRELKRQNESDDDDISRLIAKNKRLEREKLECEREKIEGNAKADIRAGALRTEIRDLEQELVKSREQLAKSVDECRGLEQQIIDLGYELEVNQELFNNVYKFIIDLDLLSNQYVARFQQCYIRHNPTAMQTFHVPAAAGAPILPQFGCARILPFVPREDDRRPAPPATVQGKPNVQI